MTSEGRFWRGSARNAAAMIRAFPFPSGFNSSTNPSSCARVARMSCSFLGFRRGTITARLSKDRISHMVL